MVTILIISVSTSVGISFLCSLMEAALYAISLPYVRHQAQTGHRIGKLLLQFKRDMGKPIAAILILNTVAHTVGASVAGYAVGELYGPGSLVPFSIFYTLAVLYLSEILPKLIGVVHSRVVVTIFADFLALMIRLFYPMIMFADFLSRRIPAKKQGEMSPQEVLSLAEIGVEEGAIDRLEASIIANIIDLDQLLVKDVLTPRVVVLRYAESALLGDVLEEIERWNFSRIPIFSANDPDYITGYVMQRDALMELVHGNKNKTFKELSRPIKIVPELARCDRLLLEMLREKEHICAVVDEHGGLAGIITLEDIIEEIVGNEIVDEYDEVDNLRTLARLLRFQKWRQMAK